MPPARPGGSGPPLFLLHGWPGYDNSLPFEQRLNDVMGLELGDGAPEIMKAIIARETFGPEFNSYR